MSTATLEAGGQPIRDLLARVSPSLSQSAEILGLSRQHLYRVLAGRQSPKKLFRKLQTGGFALPEEIVAARTVQASGQTKARTEFTADPKKVEALQKFLVSRREQAHLSANGLATLAKVPQSNIWSYEKRGTNMSPTTIGKIARALKLQPTEVDQLFALQQGVAPPSLRGGSAAWGCAMEAALVKQGRAASGDDAYGCVADAISLLPVDAVQQLRKQLAERSDTLEKRGLTPATVDAIIRHSNGTASLVSVNVVTLPVVEPVAPESEPNSQTPGLPAADPALDD